MQTGNIAAEAALRNASHGACSTRALRKAQAVREADRLKVGGKATVSETVAVLLKLPTVPVMVTGKRSRDCACCGQRQSAVLAVEAGLKRRSHRWADQTRQTHVRRKPFRE